MQMFLCDEYNVKCEKMGGGGRGPHPDLSEFCFQGTLSKIPIRRASHRQVRGWPSGASAGLSRFPLPSAT